MRRASCGSRSSGARPGSSAQRFWSRPLLRLAPRGDGQPVIVYPGLLAGDGSTALLRPVPRPGDVEAVVEQLVSLFGVIGSPGFPADPAALRSHIERGVRRAYDPAGTLRQLLAIIATPDRRARLKRISAPTLVIHGVDDPLVPLEAGCDTARWIPGARLMAIEGWGTTCRRRCGRCWSRRSPRAAARRGGGTGDYLPGQVPVSLATLPTRSRKFSNGPMFPIASSFGPSKPSRCMNIARIGP